MLPKGSPIEVTYAFDAAGRISVRAKDKTGGKEAAIEIERRGGLNERANRRRSPSWPAITPSSDAKAVDG